MTDGLKNVVVIKVFANIDVSGLVDISSLVDVCCASGVFGIVCDDVFDGCGIGPFASRVLYAFHVDA